MTDWVADMGSDIYREDWADEAAKKISDGYWTRPRERTEAIAIALRKARNEGREEAEKIAKRYINGVPSHNYIAGRIVDDIRAAMGEKS